MSSKSGPGEVGSQNTELTKQKKGRQNPGPGEVGPQKNRVN